MAEPSMILMILVIIVMSRSIALSEQIGL